MAASDYLTSNTGISYPFAQGQDLPESITRLFVDAVVHADDYSVAVTSVNYSTADATLRFTVDGVSFSESISDHDGFAVVGNERMRFVIDFGYLYGVTEIAFTGRAEIEKSCIDTGCERVTSIEIYNGPADPRNAIITGDIVLDAGYNISFETLSGDNAVRLLASPGTGLGKVPCTLECDKDPDTLGETLPNDNGNAVITGDECYDVTAKGSTIQIRGKCVACCQCQMYIDILNELKIIAEKIKDINTKVDDTTEVYFSHIDRMSLSSGKAEVDIQLNVSPDATIMRRGYVREDTQVTEYSDFQAFRVTCVVTNTSGVPCLFAVPDQWSPSDFAQMFAGYPHSFTFFDESIVSEPKFFCQNGLVSLTSPVANGNLFPIHLGSHTVPTSEYYYAQQDKTSTLTEKLGWVNSSRVLTTTKRTNDDKIAFTSPIPYTYSGYPSRLEAAFNEAKSRFSNWAIDDLNKGVNPSYMIDYAGYMMDQISASSLGYYMPPGESVSISNVYAIPGEKLTTGLAWVGAHFVCAVFCPTLAYTQAYNQARPVTRYETSDKRIDVITTWEHGDNEDAAISMNRLFRRYFVTAGYNISTGKLSVLAPENG